jgi:hypothetical protein
MLWVLMYQLTEFCHSYDYILVVVVQADWVDRNKLRNQIGIFVVMTLFKGYMRKTQPLRTIEPIRTVGKEIDLN